MEKNIDLVDGCHKKKILSRWIDTIGENFFFRPMVNTISQPSSNILNQWIDTINIKHN
jgi:hypothetical protein